MKLLLRQKHAASAEETGLSATRKRWLVIGGVVVVLFGLGYALHVRGTVSTDDAFVDGRVHPITPRVPGYVNTVPVDDNQLVKAGDVLVELDPTDYQVALAQARADLAAAESQLAALELGVPLQLSQTSSRVTEAKAQLESQQRNLERAVKEREAAQHAVAQVSAQLDQDQLDYGRVNTLRHQEVVSQSDLDSIENKRRGHQAELRAVQSLADAATRRLAVITADIKRLQAAIELAATGQDQAAIQGKQAAAQRAKVDLAKERVRQAELNLSYTKIVAPVTGHVTKKQIEAGRMVAAGQALMTVVPLDPGELWVTANYKETQLEDVRPGQKVTLVVDTYSGRELTGHVDSIMAGTGSVFSLFPTENASGNYVKVVQRIPVKIVFDKTSGAMPPLRLGMSVVPVIHTR